MNNEERVAVELRKRAEEIAKRTIRRINQISEEFGMTSRITDSNPNAVKIATLAAMMALNERDGAR